MFIQYIDEDPSLIPGYYVDSPINGLTGPFNDPEAAEEFVQWAGEEI